jgi:hypothetical protein
VVQGVIDPAGAAFELQAQAALDRVPVLAGFDLTAAGFFIAVNVPSVEVGFDATAQLTLSQAAPSPANTLTLAVTFAVGTAGASFQASITGPWVTPLGVRGVTLLSGTVSLGLGGDFGLANFGITGTLQVGSVQGSVVFLSDGLVLGNTVYAVQLAGVDLEKDLIAAICGGSVAGSFGSPSMQTATLSVNPTLHTVSGKYPPGIAVSATGFKVGSITLQLVYVSVSGSVCLSLSLSPHERLSQPV